MHWFVDNWTELVGNALNVLCIFLLYRNIIWNWPVGIANCVFYIVLFLPGKLYGDAGLQGVYIVLSLFGWWEWKFGGERRRERPLSYASTTELAVSFGVTIVATIGLGWVIGRFTDSDVVVWDALLTGLSLWATWLMALRKIQNWYIWFATNVGYFFLYAHKGLHITQWCQPLFLALSIFGLLYWIKEWKLNTAAASS